MESVAYVAAGKTPSKDSFVEDGVPYFKMYNLRGQKIDFDFRPQYIRPEVHYETLAKSRIHPGDLIMNIVGPPLGKLAIVPERFPEANTNQAAVVIRPDSSGIPVEWLFYYLSEMTTINRIATRGSAGQVNISLTQSKAMLVPVPPLAEQRRIVAELDRLLALVDGVERDSADLDALRARARSKVLDLAVRGLLVPQDASDEPAAELLARAAEERARLVRDGRARAPKGGPSVIERRSDGAHYEKRGGGDPVCIDDEIPYDLPEGWAWARLCNLATFGGGKTPPTGDATLYEEGGVPWVTSKDVKKTVLDGTQITLSAKGAAALEAYPPGTLVIVTRSGILKRLLPVARLSISATVNQDIKAIVPLGLMESDWLLTFFMANDSYIRGKLGKDGTTVQSVNFDLVKKMLVPVPPLAEQRRIVDMVKKVSGILTSL